MPPDVAQPAALLRDGKQQLIFLAARNRGHHRVHASSLPPGGCPRFDREGTGVEPRATPAGGADLANRIGQAVAQIHRRPRRPSPTHRHSEPDARFGTTLFLDTGSPFAKATGDKGAIGVGLAQHFQTSPGATKRPAHPNLVAGNRAGPRQPFSRLYGAAGRDIHDQRPGGPGDIPADHRNPVCDGQGGEAIH